MKLWRARSSPTKRAASLSRSSICTASIERELRRPLISWPMKRPACQCSETRVRDRTETQANRVKFPVMDSTTPWVSGVIGRFSGLLCSQARPGKLFSDQPRLWAASGNTRV